MTITKDEARLLAIILYEYKEDFSVTLSYVMSKKLVERLEILENKLREGGKDKRRCGRTSMNDNNDLIRRLIKDISIPDCVF